MTEAKKCNGKCASCNRKCKADRVDIPLSERTFQARIDRKTETRDKENGYRSNEKTKYTTKDHDYNYCVRKGYVSEEQDLEKLRNLPKGSSMKVKAKTTSKDGHQTRVSKTKIVRTNSKKSTKPAPKKHSIQLFGCYRDANDPSKVTAVWKYSNEPTGTVHETRVYRNEAMRAYFNANGSRFYIDEFTESRSPKKGPVEKATEAYYQDWTCAMPEVYPRESAQSLIDGLVKKHPDATVEWIDRKGHHDAEIWWTWKNGEQSGIIHIWDDLSPKKYDTGY